MNDLAASGTLVAAGTALWLGVLTSVSPCPLASNIAAISYIGKGIAQSAKSSGRRFALYARPCPHVRAARLAAGGESGIRGRALERAAASDEPVARTGADPGRDVHAGTASAGTAGSLNLTAGLQQRAGRWGLGGAAALGALFALSFCPVSAALFFGSLIPLAMTSGSSIVMPSLYGVGTGLPVLAFAVVVGFGAQALSQRVSTDHAAGTVGAPRHGRGLHCGRRVLLAHLHL